MFIVCHRMLSHPSWNRLNQLHHADMKADPRRHKGGPGRLLFWVMDLQQIICEIFLTCIWSSVFESNLCTSYVGSHDWGFLIRLSLWVLVRKASCLNWQSCPVAVLPADFGSIALKIPPSWPSVSFAALPRVESPCLQSITGSINLPWCTLVEFLRCRLGIGVSFRMFEVGDWLESHSVTFCPILQSWRLAKSVQESFNHGRRRFRWVQGHRRYPGVSDLDRFRIFWRVFRNSIPNLNRKATFQDFSGCPGYPGVYSGYIWLYLAIIGCRFKSLHHPQVPHVAMRLVL